jgi:hypothetical protein
MAVEERCESYRTPLLVLPKAPSWSETPFLPERFPTVVAARGGSNSVHLAFIFGAVAWNYHDAQSEYSTATSSCSFVLPSAIA